MIPLLMVMLLMTSCVAGQDTQNCTGCYTKQCISVIDAAIYGVDESVSPCDDFYKYACGGWMQSQFLTPERKTIKFADTDVPLGATRNLLTQSIQEGDHIAVIKAKSLYNSCYNYVPGTDSTLVYIVWNMANGWTFGCEDCDIASFNLEDFLFQAIRMDVHPLFKLSARAQRVEEFDATKRVKQPLFIDEPTLQVPIKDYDYILAETQFGDVYIDKIITAFRRFGINNETLGKEDAMAIVITEVQISVILNSTMQEETIIKSSLDIVDANYGQLMNWTRFVKRIAALEEIGIHDIAFNETVYIKNPGVLNAIITYFLSLPRRTQINYLMWRVVDSLDSVLVKPEDKINDLLLYHVYEPFDKEYRVEPCVWFVTKVFPLVVYRMLYAEHLPLEKIEKVNAMIQQIQYEFTSLLADHNWLDQDARRVIQEKMDTITIEFSYFREAMNDTFLDSYYRNVTVDLITQPRRRNFLQNIPIVRKDAFAKNFRTIRQPVRSDAGRMPQIFTAFTSVPLHDIVLNPGVFQYPWFLDEAPMVVNYAGAGYVIAHELVHLFDLSGFQTHRNGTWGLWFGNATTTEFVTRLDCLIDQYHGYWYKPARMFVDAFKTLDENIADNVGFKLAYKAYRNYTNTATTRDLNFTYQTFSNDELFFVRAAQLWCVKQSYDAATATITTDDHSPAEFTVNGALQNCREFADVFRCPPGSPMNPVNKCEVW